MWTLLLLCLMGGPGLTSNGWINVIRLWKERSCNQHPGWVASATPGAVVQVPKASGQTGDMIRFSPGLPR